MRLEILRLVDDERVELGTELRGGVDQRGGQLVVEVGLRSLAGRVIAERHLGLACQVDTQ